MCFNIKIISTVCGCCLQKEKDWIHKEKDDFLNEPRQPLIISPNQNFDETSHKPKNFYNPENKKETEAEEKKSTEKVKILGEASQKLKNLAKLEDKQEMDAEEETSKERVNLKNEDDDVDLITIKSCEWFLSNFKADPIRILGKGGFGKVYEVINLKKARKEALKIMKTEDFKEINEFTKELLTLRTLDHPNIIEIYDFYINSISFKKNGKEFREYQVMISMEKANDTLEAVKLKIMQGAFTKENLFSLIKDLAQGLQHAHSKKICHNDLKPQNIFIFYGKDEKEANIKYKIGDWGAGAFLRESSTRTNFKDGMGFTYGFSAPEIVNEKENINFFKSDIYSLGATLLMCCGAKMKDLKKLSNTNKHDFNNCLQKILNKHVLPIYDEETATLIAKMLDYYPNKRLDLKQILVQLKKKPNPSSKPIIIPININNAGLKKEINMKIILLGNVKVGKTSIISRLVKDSFDLHQISTIGLDYVIFLYEKLNVIYKMHIWDTAGQERFAQIAFSALKGADGIFFVIENDMNSLEYVKNYVRICDEKYHMENYAKILLFNKNDIDEPCIHNLDEIKNIMGFEWYFKVSAKTGENIRNAFEIMADEIFLNRKKHSHLNTENKFNYPLQTKFEEKKNTNKRCC